MANLIAEMCLNAGTRFFEAKEFFNALEAYGNGLKAEPSNVLLLDAFRKAAFGCAINFPPNEHVWMFHQLVAKNPTQEALPDFVNDLSSYLAKDYLVSMRSLGNALQIDATCEEIMYYFRCALFAYVHKLPATGRVPLYKVTANMPAAASVHDFVMGMFHYVVKDYAGCLILFGNAWLNDPKNEEVKFYVQSAIEARMHHKLNSSSDAP